MDIGTATTGTMEVPYTVVGLIIGQQGKNVRQLRDMYGVTLNVGKRLRICKQYCEIVSNLM